jgi:multimeric flavodoxin WrbA
MLLLAIFGSPRKDGNTDLMMNSFIEGALSAANIELQKFYIRDLKFSGCQSCGYCDEHGVCVQQDDMQKVYPFFDVTQRIVIASPIYFYGLSGQTKLLVDRSQAPYMRKYKRKAQGLGPLADTNKKGFFLCAGATRGKRLFDCPVLTVSYFFDALDAEYTGELCFRQIDEKGSIRNHATALEECRQAGAAFVKD